MSKIKKLKEKLLNGSSSFTFEELKTLLSALDFTLYNKGKTSGSRLCFVKDDIMIILHRPHPRNELKKYQIKEIRDILLREGLL